MSGTFDFCTTSRVVQELPPDETSAVSFNGWEFTSKPAIPYRRSFNVTLHGMRWYINSAGTGLDVTTNPGQNAGRLLNFYQSNRTWDVFTLNHEYLGPITCRFQQPLTIPPAIPNSGGAIGPFDVKLIHYNPGYS